MSKILSDIFQKSPSESQRALGRSPPVPQLELGPRGAQSGSGASARPSLSPAPGMLPIFPGMGSTAQELRSAVSYIEARVNPWGRGRASKAAARWHRDRDPALPRGRPVRGRAVEQSLPLAANTAWASPAASPEPRPLLCPSLCSPNRPGVPGTVSPSPSVLGTRLPPRGTAIPSCGLGAETPTLKAERPRRLIPLGQDQAHSADPPSRGALAARLSSVKFPLRLARGRAVRSNHGTPPLRGRLKEGERDSKDLIQVQRKLAPFPFFLALAPANVYIAGTGRKRIRC